MTQTDRLAKQYDKFEAAPGLFVNGKLTLGENIADLGGAAHCLRRLNGRASGKRQCAGKN